jgi:hypothetical protein
MRLLALKNEDRSEKEQPYTLAESQMVGICGKNKGIS